MNTQTTSHRRTSRRLALFAVAGVALLPLAACDDGADPADAAAATERFCDSAEEARDAGDEIDVLSGDPERLESDVHAVLIRYETVLDRAPAAFRDTAEALVEQQQRAFDLLDDHDWDALAAFDSPEGQEIAADPSFERVQAERDAYLLEHCGLEPAAEVSPEVQLAGGEDGIRQLILLLQAASWDIDGEQAECITDGLLGKVDDGDITAFAQGDSEGVSEAGKILINVVFSDCAIVVPE